MSSSQAHQTTPTDAASTSPQQPQDGGASSEAASGASQPVLGLPAPSDAPAAAGEEPQTSFKLDHLGPVIVNTDGTISRIAGWTELSDIEKQRSLRLLAKRNNARMEALRNGGGVETHEPTT